MKCYSSCIWKNLKIGGLIRFLGAATKGCFSTALAPKPDVLLLDEPLSALDYKLRRGMQIELKRLQLETGITFIFVTHDQEEALTCLIGLR
ncbi:MAG: hypothetical protein CM15mP54_14030 [Paracoccaceae bacterium]|nr:MAG: hypothetical protein CM15mP54_14030 [Paracoccaceae bacterium]